MKPFSPLLCALLVWLTPFAAAVAVAQGAYPYVEPTMIYTTADGETVEETTFDGDAPLDVHCEASQQNLGDWEARYEWQFTRQGETSPFLTRYEEQTDYRFTGSGTYQVKLLVTFVKGDDTIEWDEMDAPFTLTFAESKLEVPNAFTPNGDGINDIFRVKEGHRSILSFKGIIFSRWGKKIFEWTDINSGWDGRTGGKNAPDGAYYLRIEAKGADGKNYEIKKVINLLRGYSEAGSAGNATP